MRKRLLEIYQRTGRFHDLFIILAWAGVLTGVMLNAFYHRSCSAFQTDVTDPCQSVIDLALIFGAGVGAGLALDDERAALVGFIVVQLLASGLFVVTLAIPSSLGLADPAISDVLFIRSLVIAFRYAFPFGIFASLVGSVFGLYLEGRLRLS